MMLQVKKQFQPSLAPISEILDLQQLEITKPIIRDGYIRREVGFISSWKQRIFAILFVPAEKLTISVYTKDSGQPEEIIDLNAAKLSKKCSNIEERICFGVVTDDKKKYLISLKSSRECLKYFYEIVSAKKMLKQSLLRSPNSKINPISRSFDQSPIKQQEQSQKWSNLKEQKVETQTEKQSIEPDEEQNVSQHISEFMMRKKRGCQDAKTLSEKSIPQTRAETIPFKPEIKELQKKIGLSRIEENKMDALDMFAYQKMQSLDGFTEIEQLTHGKIYRNKDNTLKVINQISFDQSTRSLIELFIHFDSWNHGVRSFKILNPVEKGVYRVSLDFYKIGCFSKQKHCQNLLALYKAPDGFFFNLKPLNHIPTSMKHQNWINFRLAAKVKENPHCHSQKKMIITIESSESSKVLVEFAKEMRHFQQYLKTSVELPDKLLEVRSSLSA